MTASSSRVEVDSSAVGSRLPWFHECYIDELEGRVSLDDLPPEKFDANCVVDRFTETPDTTAKALTLDLPLGTRVCLTILKKLFEQSGSGRKRKCTTRDLITRKRLVPTVLRVLQSEGLAAPGQVERSYYLASSPRQQKTSGRMLAAPITERDSVLDLCGKL